MASIMEQNMLLLKTYHQALLNCTIDPLHTSDNSSTSSAPAAGNNLVTLPQCDPNLVLEMRHALLNTFDNLTITQHNESYIGDDQFDTNRFFIKDPHDMLHPSQINPSILPIIITHSLTFLIGVIGNCVVIATWSMHGKFRSPTAVFLVSLAIADLLLMLVVVPLETLEYFMITWGGLSSICKTIAYVEVISAMSTVLNLVAVSIERFLVIVYPMRARSWCTMSSTRKGLVIIWGLAMILSTPVLLTKHTSQITYYNATTSLTLYYCFDVENDLTFGVAVYQLVVMFVLPAVFMVVCYYVVIRQLWVSTRSVNAMTRAENQVHESHSMSNMSNHRGNSSLLRKEGDSTNEPSSNDPTRSLGLNGLHRETQSNWRRYLSLTHIWQQWRLARSADSLALNELRNNQENRMHNGADQNADTKGHLHRHSQWDGSQDSNASSRHKHRCPQRLTMSCLCYWCCPTCDSTSTRHVGDELSECTMSSSYQMTSYGENCSRLRSDPTNSEVQSPIDVPSEMQDDLGEHVFYANTQSNHHSTRHVHTGDNHHPAPPQNYSRTLPSNVMEITRSRFQVIKMLVLIVVLFLLCWGPRLIMNVLVKLGLPIYSNWIYNTRIVCNLLSFVHSALNPFVYGFMSSNFRAMVCSSFHRRRSGGGKARQSASNNNNVRSKQNSAKRTTDELPRNTSQLKRY